MPVLKAMDFEPSKVEFGQVRSTKFGTFVSINYDGGELFIHTPELFTPFDSNYFPDKEKNSGKWTVRTSLKGGGDVAVLEEKLSELDNIVKNKVIQNSQSWMKKKNMSVDVINEIYNPTIKVSLNKETGEPDGKWPSSFQFKLEHKDDAMKCKIYDKSKNEQVVDLEKPNPLGDVLVKGSNIKALIKCSCLWIINGKLGISWVAEQLRVDQGQSQRIIGYALDSDEEDVNNDNYVKSDSDSDNEDEGGNESEEMTPEPKKPVAKKRVVKKKN